PLEETMGALDAAVRQGKALYAGISNYPHELTRKASQILRQMGTPCLIHQARYSMFDRWVEGGLLDVLEEEGIGCIVFSPLAQGLLTNKYLNGIPEGSRAAKANTHLESSAVTPEKVAKARKLNEIALQRGQSLAQMALAWLLKDRRVTSVLVGASSVNQLQDNLKTLTCTDFTEDELQAIEKILAE
ncbi:MAG: aldo/keto reductase, partial [Bacteroidales bacterium]|nr:aldo/keto reductase [Bacteroidales bacterium]